MSAAAGAEESSGEAEAPRLSPRWSRVSPKLQPGTLSGSLTRPWKSLGCGVGVGPCPVITQVCLEGKELLGSPVGCGWWGSGCHLFHSPPMWVSPSVDCSSTLSPSDPYPTPLPAASPRSHPPSRSRLHPLLPTPYPSPKNGPNRLAPSSPRTPAPSSQFHPVPSS